MKPKNLAAAHEYGSHKDNLPPRQFLASSFNEVVSPEEMEASVELMMEGELSAKQFLRVMGRRIAEKIIAARGDK